MSHRVAFRLWAALALTVSEADGWLLLAEDQKRRALQAEAQGKKREAAMMTAHAEALTTAGKRIHALLADSLDEELQVSVRPARWSWLLLRRLRRLTRP